MMYSAFLAAICVLVFGGTPARAQNETASFRDSHSYVKISDRLSTSGQITQAQVRQIREAGFEVVVNLATADPERNQTEGFTVVQEGMTYMHIPVSWQEPSLRDLEQFFDIMTANQQRKVFVHCFANMRVSVFVYLYRTLKVKVPEEEAVKDLYKIWDPASQSQWEEFIRKAKKHYSSRD